MDSTTPSNEPAGDAVSGDQLSNSINSVSYFHKTICLQDWWLIKVDTNGQGQKLGVAGFTSREYPNLSPIVLVFAIAKYYDTCTLETMDGVCVILNGLINKSRTLENGFPSEVFTYFVRGFPPFWEKYAGYLIPFDTTSFRLSVSMAAQQSAFALGAKSVTRNFLATLFSIEQEPIINTNSGLCSKDTRKSNDMVDDVKLDMFEFELAPSETSSFNKDSLFTVSKSLVVEPNCIDIECSESSTNSKRSVKDVMSFENPASVSHDKGSSLCVDDSILCNLAVESRDLEEAAVASDGRILCRQLFKSKRVVQNALGLIGCLNKSGRPKQEKKTCGSTPKLGGLGHKNCLKNESKGKVDVAKDASASGKKTERRLSYETPAKQEKEEEASILPIDSLSCKRSRSGRLLLPSLEFWRSQTLVYNTDGQITGIKDDPCTTRAVEERDSKEVAVSDGRILSRQLRESTQVAQNPLVVLDCEREDGRPKMGKKAGRSTSKVGGVGRKNYSKNEVKGKVAIAKDSSASGIKTKRKLNYETPAKQGKEEEASILPIDSLSCKRSRSGRLLLPSLEFWRNQTLVYNTDGQITGIKDDPCTARGNTSGPPKKL